MARRESKNITNIKRIPGISVHGAFVSFICVRCSQTNFLFLGDKLLSPSEAYETQSWKCKNCKFVHGKSSSLPLKDNKNKGLPFKDWDKNITRAGSIAAQRFWKAFFTATTESRDAYWKQCNTCGRILPVRAFSGHTGWGPLEKQMECRSCKAVINTNLNPKRTKEQLHESAAKRRTAELLLLGENERLNLEELFKRFDSKCFKTGKVLNINDRHFWAIDHILPSRWLYPLSYSNAALLSKEANDNKRDKWPSEFYTNEELKKLAGITGSDLGLISRKEPIINPNIDVDACVTRMLTVRGATDLTRRIKDLKKLLEDYELVENLSEQNKKILGYTR
ncbi:MAG: hypothetical protein UT43_C0002G0001 [Parcubacteria group bacterium GW2011_GWC1_39_29]|nr:MAG: hypothetical protein UT43_C0002G0001 [Parcubacteria group bacterium GW2011_GWC1_39_29]